MSKWREWLWRYLPANLFSTTITLLVAWIVYHLTGNRIAAAFAGSIVDVFAYYGFILIRDMLATRKKLHRRHKKYTFIHALKNARNLILEFSVGELLDTLFIRPFCLYWGPIIIGNYTLGIIVGKYLSDIAFYIPTIISYELRKKHLKD